MTCQCEIYEICRECATTPIEYETAVKAHNDVVRQIQPTPKSYTLAQLEQLAREYCDEWERETDSTQTEFRLALSLLFQWAKQRESNNGK